VIMYLLVTLGLQGLPHWLMRGAGVLGIAVALLSLLLLYLLFHKQHSHEIVSGHKWASQFLHLLDELHKLGQARTLMKTFGVSFLFMLFQAISVWSLLQADQYDFDLRQATLILVVYRIATVVPNAPGNIGWLQFSTFLGVRLAGGEEGLAFGEVNFVFITLARLLQGGIAILLTGVNLTEIHRHAGRAHKTPMEPRRIG
jgi:uncharacterized membrane protein YbhN (UPF0104 family)